METKTLGIVGGLGVDATAAFYADLAYTIFKVHAVMPSILIQNVPISHYLYGQLAYNSWSEADKLSIYTLLWNACKTLEAANVTAIVIPCNSVHGFIEDLRADCNVPIISIIEATQAAICKTAKKVAILASHTTIQMELYQKSLLKNGMIPFLVDDTTQNQVTELIMSVLQNTHTHREVAFMQTITQDLKKKGCDAIILGCTELPLLVQSDNTIISCLAALKRMAVQALTQPVVKRVPHFAM